MAAPAIRHPIAIPAAAPLVTPPLLLFGLSVGTVVAVGIPLLGDSEPPGAGLSVGEVEGLSRVVDTVGFCSVPGAIDVTGTNVSISMKSPGQMEGLFWSSKHLGGTSSFGTRVLISVDMVKVVLEELLKDLK